MRKKILSLFFIFTWSLLLCLPNVYADDSHEHTFGEVEDVIDTSGLKLPNGQDFPISCVLTRSPCSTPDSNCDKVKYSWNFMGRGGSFIDDKSTPMTTVIAHWYKWNEDFYGKNVGFEKMDTTNAGDNIPASGGRNPKGYGDEGKANITSTGVEVLWVEPLGISADPGVGFSSNSPKSLSASKNGSGGGLEYFNSTDVRAVYYFTAPVSGLYYIGSSGNPYDFGTFLFSPTDSWQRLDFIFSYSKPFEYSCSLQKGETAYLLIPSGGLMAIKKSTYKFYLNNAPVFVDPLGESNIATTNNITISNNTWNGNIYVDKSNHLTYIYPQYTTINENNETVTNISTNPIIYNNETYQYYTYDQTTKNYYYITYPNQPTPPPTATPSPTPDSDTERPVQDMYYRWVLAERRGTDDGGYNAIQVSELVFYDENKNVIPWPSDVTVKSSLDTSWNEPISNLVDNNTKNKWGCNKWGSSTTGNCVIDIYAPNMQIPSYYGYVTGSDMPARDPVSWKLYYSFDGLKYYEASTMEQAADIPTERNAETEKWPFNYQSPTPSPTPTPTPGGGSSGGNGDNGGSGSSWWEKLLSKIGDAIVDGLLGAISAVLKLILKLFTTILGWVIWLVSQVLTLFPFLPPGLGGLLVGGVVVCFVIGIIKFIRG